MDVKMAATTRVVRRLSNNCTKKVTHKQHLLYLLFIELGELHFLLLGSAQNDVALKNNNPQSSLKIVKSWWQRKSVKVARNPQGPTMNYGELFSRWWWGETREWQDRWYVGFFLRLGGFKQIVTKNMEATLPLRVGRAQPVWNSIRKHPAQTQYKTMVFSAELWFHVASESKLWFVWGWPTKIQDHKCIY